ncbi:hypothetical protein [uncultured Cohaesibacter sp.]|jgi:hypothetical protein|uniref:hypothetical protein n=1 Tax=uncultured Cohaesibacter sp. TaxID=1002546 RepID=UPI0029C74DF0|nr:hypothetical protein [uncultured Cohaesibacter sp.]
MIEKYVEVTITVKVTVDETKFTDDFMEEFRESFFSLYSIDEHCEHLAQMNARGVAHDFSDSFIEGYGPPKEMGISFEEVDLSTEVVEAIS